MFLHRVQRRRLVTFLVGVLMLTQWLVAAHACVPAHAGAPLQDGVTVPMAAPHCHEAEGAHGIEAPAHDAGLCLAHCAADGQVPTSPAAADLAAPALGWCLVAAPLPVPTVVTVAALAAPVRAGAPPGWPPLYLLHGVLRN